MGRDLALTFAKQSPTVAGLIVVVVLFLQHLDTRDRAFADMLESVEAGCHQVQGEALRTIDRNTEAIMNWAQRGDRK